MKEKKPDDTRGAVAFGFVILLGLVIGVLIKRVTVGIVIGLAIGLLASGTLRRR